MLKKTTTNHNSTAGLNGSAAVSTRPTTLPDGGFDTVKNLNGDDVSLTEVVEAFCKSLYGTLDIPAGQRHTAIFSLSQQLAGWLGSDSVNSILYSMRNVAPAYPDFVVDVQSGCSSKYRYDTVSYQLRPVLEQFNIIRPFKSKSSSNVSASTATATATTSTAPTSSAQAQQATADASSSAGAELLAVSTGGGDLPTDVFNCLPTTLRMCIDHIPRWMRQPFLFMLLPIICMYTSASASELDGVSSRLVLYSCTLGEASSGKSRLQKWIRHHFLKQILDDDEKERQKLQTYIQAKQKANGSQSLQTAKPEVGVRVISKISTNMLLEYMKIANKKQQSMLLITDEISGLVAGAKQSSYTDLSQIIRCGYNGDSLSADSLSLASSNLSVDVNLNVCVAGQIGFMLQWFGDVTDGSSSRYLVSFLEQNMLETPRFESLTDDEQKQVDQFLDAIKNFKPQGPIELPRTKRVISQWRESIVADIMAQQEQGLPFDKCRFSFSIRAATNALRASALLYIMNGGVEDARNEKFALYICEEGLKNIYTLCADQLNKVDENIEKIKSNRSAYQSSNAKLLEMLPDTFSVSDVQAAQQKLGLKHEETNAKTKISELTKLRAVKHSSKGKWTKQKVKYKK